MSVKPYPYQKEGVRAMEKFLAAGGGALLADDMGLGKTLQALWLLKRARVGEMFPALVVCPAMVKYGWEHEALKHVGLRAQVLEGQKPPTGRIGLIPDLMVINPDILSFWVPYLLKLGIKTIVLDECQFYGNPKSKRTKAALALCRKIGHRVALSGTPLTNRPSELFPTLHMLRPDIFPSFFAFAQTYCDPRRRPWGWEYKGATNIEQLHALLRGTCMIRRLKEDVLHDLPDKVRQVIPMDVSDRAQYQQAKHDFLNWMRETQTRTATKRSTKAVAITKIGYLLRLAAKLKARNVVDWINAFLAEYPKEKLVVFAVHRKMISLLQRRLNAKSVTIDGEVGKHKRKLAVEQFRRDPETRLFIGNIRAAGTGVDGLQAACTNAVFAEMWWRPGDLIQAEDRIYRIGQKGTAWIHYLIAGDTIEEDLCRVVQAKQSVIRATLDGEDPEDLDIFNQLMEEMRK